MGKPITKEFGQNKTILKFFPYLGATCLLEQSGTYVTTDATTGRKYVKAGTPFPKNDATCVGYILEEIDVTQGDAVGTYVFEGTIDNKKLTEAGISVASTAKGATPRVTFFD